MMLEPVQSERRSRYLVLCSFEILYARSDARASKRQAQRARSSLSIVPPRILRKQ